MCALFLSIADTVPTLIKLFSYTEDLKRLDETVKLRHQNGL
jgi:hypothetical protein